MASMNEIEQMLLAPNRVSAEDLRVFGYSAARSFLQKQANMSEEIAKTARDHHLNANQIERVVEAANRGAFGSLFKTEESKQIEFPVADARIVHELLGQEGSTKTAGLLDVELMMHDARGAKLRDLDDFFSGGLVKVAEEDRELANRSANRDLLRAMDFARDLRSDAGAAAENAKVAAMELRSKVKQTIDLGEANPEAICQAITGLAKSPAVAKLAAKVCFGDDAPVAKEASRHVNGEHPVAEAFVAYEKALIDSIALEKMASVAEGIPKHTMKAMEETDRLLSLAIQGEGIAKEAGLKSAKCKSCGKCCDGKCKASNAVRERLTKVRQGAIQPLTPAAPLGYNLPKAQKPSVKTPDGQPKLAGWLDDVGGALKNAGSKVGLYKKEMKEVLEDPKHYTGRARDDLKYEAHAAAENFGNRQPNWSTQDVRNHANLAGDAEPSFKNFEDRVKMLNELDPDQAKKVVPEYTPTEFGKGAGRAAGMAAIGAPAIAGVHALANKADKVDANAGKKKAWATFAAEYPDISNNPKAQQHFNTLWSVAPAVAADPAVAGPWLKRATDYSATGLDLKTVKEAAETQRAIGDARASLGYGTGAIRAQLGRTLASAV